MKQIIKTLISTFILIIMCFNTVFAFDYSYFTFNSKNGYYRSNDKYQTLEEAYIDMGNWLNNNYKYVSFYNTTCSYKSGGYSFIIFIDDIERIENENEYMKYWLSVNMPNIVPAGTDGITALRLINDWIYNNIDYEVNLPSSHFAITGLTTRKFSCLGFSNLFGMMAEYVPFNCDTGLADYSGNGNFWHFDSKIVIGNKHAWNAININGTWYYFDTTFNESSDSPDSYFMKTTDEFYDGREHKTILGPWIRPYIDPALFIG